MVDFSFSYDNIKEAFEIENSKGVLKKEDFHSEYWAEIENLKQIKEGIKKLNDKLNKNNTKDKRNHSEYVDLTERKKDINIKISEINDKHIRYIVDLVGKNDFQINFTKSSDYDESDKPVYKVKNIESRLASKCISQNLGKIFKAQPASRNQILSQLQLILKSKTPKYLIRTDLKSFYESIPQYRLLDKLENTGLLSSKTLNLISTLFDSYNEQAEIENKKGIPRGISFSAYLAEIYLEEIDSKIKKMEGVLYYTRYVDDIIIITHNNKDLDQYLSEIELLFSFYELDINKQKTSLIDLSLVEYTKSFSYLGYDIEVVASPNNENLVIFKMSQRKYKKYADRINIALTTYTANTHKSKIRNTEAIKLLYKCLYFLTYNSFLTGTKNGVRVGVCWSNTHLTNIDQLRELDNLLYQYLNDKSVFCPNTRLYNFDVSKPNLYQDKVEKLKKEILERFSFEKGFTEKRFHKLSSIDYKQIKHVFKDEA